MLAAGRGTRMKSALPKVLHPLAGAPLIAHVLATARALDRRTCSWSCATSATSWRRRSSRAPRHGHRRPGRDARHRPCRRAGRRRAARRLRTPGEVLVLNGDVPLLNASTLSRAAPSATAPTASPAPCSPRGFDDPTGLRPHRPRRRRRVRPHRRAEGRHRRRARHRRGQRGRLRLRRDAAARPARARHHRERAGREVPHRRHGTCVPPESAVKAAVSESWLVAGRQRPGAALRAAGAASTRSPCAAGS